MAKMGNVRTGSALVKQSGVLSAHFPKGVSLSGEWIRGEGPLCGEEIHVFTVSMKTAVTHTLAK